MKTVSPSGAPTDVVASARGAGMGPDAVRVAGVYDALRAMKLNVIDHGNLAGPPTPWTPPQGGIRHLEEVVAWNRSVFDRVAAVLAAGQVPLLMGGDHCLAIGSISAGARRCRGAGEGRRGGGRGARGGGGGPGGGPAGGGRGGPV